MRMLVSTGLVGINDEVRTTVTQRESRLHSVRLVRTVPIVVWSLITFAETWIWGAQSLVYCLAVLIGWTQLGGRCGTAHVNTMRMLWKMNKGVWLRASAAYSIAGTISAGAVGLMLGWVGSLLLQLLTPIPIQAMWLITAAVAVTLAVREAGLVEFWLPQRDCQTERNWAYKDGWVWASAMWGFHIGASFSTVITYGGFWALVAWIIMTGDSVIGLNIMLCYWAGRCLPLWTFGPTTNGVPGRHDVLFRIFRPVQVGCLLALAGLASVTS